MSMRYYLASTPMQGGSGTMNQADKKRETEQKPMNRRDPIDENLKRVYEETASEPLPDRFVELLNRLREKKKD